MHNNHRPQHTHRFDHFVVRYDKEHNECVIKHVLVDHGPGFLPANLDDHLIHDYQNQIEQTEYFKQLDNRI